jgi:uncharacterized protein YbgA (DUF1722 family)/uncharacterized protein YbbK (DUF523 family)
MAGTNAELNPWGEDRPRIGISSCLLGEKVRFDGGHKRDGFLTGVLEPFVDWVPVCPEVEVGMGIPRPSVRLQGDLSALRMVADKSGRDWTHAMRRYSRRRVRELTKLNLSGYVLKKNSPSCGMERVRVYPEKGGQPQRRGRGLFASVLMEGIPLLPVEEEGRLNDLKLRENFIERVFAYWRWQRLCAGRRTRGALVEFHTRHKLILMAHAEADLRRLGRQVAGAKGRPVAEVYAEYGTLFMDALRHQATVKRHTNVLQHMLGYFSDRLTRVEREELLGLVHDYHGRLVPLIAPITLMRHYVSKYRVAYLQDQLYLQPHPKELMLRNHV